MSQQLRERDTANYSESTVRPPYTEWSFIRRFYVFQNERVPLLALAIMGTALTAGIAHANGRFHLKEFLIASTIVVLYFLEIRLADEPKDYEHDVIFYPNRPVQRGLISLKELALVNKFVIAGGFATGLLTGSRAVLACACALQAYAFVTRREFYAREWLRNHFLLYQFSHYFQLLILDWLILTVLKIQPVGDKVLFFLFAVLMIAVFESSRTIGGAESLDSGDRYSARIGTKPALAAHVAISAIAVFYTNAVIKSTGGTTHWLLLAIGAACVAFGSVKYFRSPTAKHAELLNQTSLGMYLAACFTLLLS